MSECQHKKHSMQKQTRDFNGEVFEYEAQTCDDCGASLWNSDLEREFNLWLGELAKKKRHVFQIQFSLAQTAHDCLEKLRERFPVVDQSQLMRAMVMVYLDVVESSEEILEKIEEYIEGPDYETLVSGEGVSKKVGFNPGGMKDILAVSDMMKLKPSKVVQESLYRILLLSINEDEEMKEFWESVIIRNVEIILKAA